LFNSAAQRKPGEKRKPLLLAAKRGQKKKRGERKKKGKKRKVESAIAFLEQVAMKEGGGKKNKERCERFISVFVHALFRREKRKKKEERKF